MDKLRHFYTLYFWLSLGPAIFLFGHIVWKYYVSLRDRPRLTPEDIVYQEYFASGASQKNILTKLGGGRNCVRLVVTKELLWVTSWFPFSVLAAAYDFFHVIPLRGITSIEPHRFFGTDTLLLSYTDGTGHSHTLRLMPKNRERFLEALQFNSEAGRNQPA